MISGHAFSRAVRAHILTVAALTILILEEAEDLKSMMNCSGVLDAYENLLNDNMSPEICEELDIVKNLQICFQTNCNRLKSLNRTGKLWIQYFDQVILMLEFIRAERIGDWNLHISTIQKMLPYFHSAGHNLYAKSSHLYVQEMIELKSRLTSEEYKKFPENYFTIRRKTSHWSGVWTDMCIEQTLMRSMKTVGGLSRGRGITDETILNWIISTPVCTFVTAAVETFTGQSSSTSEQHIELRDSRKARDNADKTKFFSWLQQHNPFRNRCSDLVSLSTGIVAESNITCDMALEKGEILLQKTFGKNFADVVYTRKNKVIPIAAQMRSIKYNNETIIINSQQLFHRMVCAINSPQELKLYFKYELASFPPCLFNEGLLRKGTKSSIKGIFKTAQLPRESFPTNSKYVIDGGHLLHSVVWPKPATYGDILEIYGKYVLKHYGTNTIVIFDGYPDYATTKTEEQKRRSVAKSCSNIEIEKYMTCVTTQAQFLSNTFNKTKMISSLKQHLSDINIATHQAEADADFAIASFAVEFAKQGEPVVVAAEDSDILVLLTYLCSPEIKKLWFLCPRSKSAVYDIVVERKRLSVVSDLLLVLHAFTGCDTTSAFYKRGKLKAFKLLQSNEGLRSNLQV